MIKDEGQRGVEDKFLDTQNSYDNDDDTVSNDGS